MNNLLSIDTTHMYKSRITLETAGRTITKEADATAERSQLVLPLIISLLNDEHLDIQDISRINVETGPGSFTGIRVGATVATVVSFLLDIPIDGDEPGTLPNLDYGADLWGL